MFQIQPLPFIFRACSSRSFDSPENSGVGRNNPSLMVNLHSNPELVGSRLDQRQAPGARCCGGAARPWESLTPTLGRLKSLAHLAVVSAWPTPPQHHPKPAQAQPGSLALLVTRVRVRGRRHDPPRLQRNQPGPPPARLLRNAAPSSPARARPGASTLATAPFVALLPGQIMVWPSASSQFPHSSAFSAVRTRPRSTQRPSPTAQPGLVYSLTLHPETQEPAARTPARCGHAPRTPPHLLGACAFSAWVTWAPFFPGVYLAKSVLR